MSTATMPDRDTETFRDLHPANRRILAAAFPTPGGGSRAAAAVDQYLPGRIGNAAVLWVKPDGTAEFIELKDWGGDRAALVSAIIGIIGGPLGMPAGSGISVLAATLRETGFNDHRLRRLGNTLGLNSSVVILELAADSVDDTHRFLESLDAQQIVVEHLHPDVSDLFASRPAGERACA